MGLITRYGGIFGSLASSANTYMITSGRPYPLW